MNQRFSRGELWVIAQFVLLAAHGLVVWLLWAPAPAALRWAGAALVLVGLGLAAASMLRLGRNLTPNPKPLDEAHLVTTGVYALVRHPIYASLILICLGLATASGSLWTLAGALAVGVFFDRKAAREERWLRERYPDYPAYARRVKRLIPGVY